jgi:hypothetical protein
MPLRTILHTGPTKSQEQLTAELHEAEKKVDELKIELHKSRHHSPSKGAARPPSTYKHPMNPAHIAMVLLDRKEQAEDADAQFALRKPR